MWLVFYSESSPPEYIYIYIYVVKRKCNRGPASWGDSLKCSGWQEFWEVKAGPLGWEMVFSALERCLTSSPTGKYYFEPLLSDHNTVLPRVPFHELSLKPFYLSYSVWHLLGPKLLFFFFFNKDRSVLKRGVCS